MHLVSTALKVHYEHFGPLDAPPADKWLRIDQLESFLDPAFAGALPTTDRWGGPILIRVIDGEFLLVSAGPDGYGATVAIIDEALASSLRLRSKHEFRAMVGDDLVFADGELVAGPRSIQDRIRTTMADMRTLATATEAYAVDWGHYPMLGHGLQTAMRLDSLLSPVYIRQTPVRDGFGSSFLVKSTAREYFIVSPGIDGQPQHYYDSMTADDLSHLGNAYSEAADDLIYTNGHFAAYPWEFDRSIR